MHDVIAYINSICRLMQTFLVFPQCSLASYSQLHNVGMIFVDEHYFRDDKMYLLLAQCCSGHVQWVCQDIVAFCFDALTTGEKHCFALQTCLCAHEHKLFSVWLCCTEGTCLSFLRRHGLCFFFCQEQTKWIWQVLKRMDVWDGALLVIGQYCYYFFYLGCMTGLWTPA